MLRKSNHLRSYVVVTVSTTEKTSSTYMLFTCFDKVWACAMPFSDVLQIHTWPTKKLKKKLRKKSKTGRRETMKSTSS